MQTVFLRVHKNGDKIFFWECVKFADLGDWSYAFASMELPPIPTWAAAFDLEEDETRQYWALEVIKGGVPIARTDLGRRERWLLGRAADAVHIELQHLSVSRVHAVFQHVR